MDTVTYMKLDLYGYVGKPDDYYIGSRSMPFVKTESWDVVRPGKQKWWYKEALRLLQHFNITGEKLEWCHKLNQCSIEETEALYMDRLYQLKILAGRENGIRNRRD